MRQFNPPKFTTSQDVNNHEEFDTEQDKAYLNFNGQNDNENTSENAEPDVAEDLNFNLVLGQQTEN